jgi:vacuolar-type H+-ATPase subunit H
MAVIAKKKKKFNVLPNGDAEPWSGEGDFAGTTDQDVLQHLLDVEAGAQSLVNDAQAEADRRAAEAEKRNRARYEEQYTKEATLMDSRYEAGIEAVRAEYNGRLEEYRLSLEAHKPDYSAFCRLLDGFLRKEK